MDVGFPESLSGKGLGLREFLPWSQSVKNLGPSAWPCGALNIGTAWSVKGQGNGNSGQRQFWQRGGSPWEGGGSSGERQCRSQVSESRGESKTEPRKVIESQRHLGSECLGFCAALSGQGMSE